MLYAEKPKFVTAGDEKKPPFVDLVARFLQIKDAQGNTAIDLQEDGTLKVNREVIVGEKNSIKVAEEFNKLSTKLTEEVNKLRQQLEGLKEELKKTQKELQDARNSLQQTATMVSVMRGQLDEHFKYFLVDHDHALIRAGHKSGQVYTLYCCPGGELIYRREPGVCNNRLVFKWK
ncbi:MAG: hypothetical protein RMJ88_07385 [Thermogemmata sp.]|nr:hypothetical protein [Thermogemmata sp.]